MKQWEYLNVVIDDTGYYQTGESEKTRPNELNPRGLVDKWSNINDLGKAGWEMVNFVWLTGSEGWAIFKREIYPSA